MTNEETKNDEDVETTVPISSDEKTITPNDVDDELDPSEFSQSAEEDGLGDDVDEETLREYHKLVLAENDVESIGKALTNSSIRLGPELFAQQIVKLNTYEELLKRMIDSHTEQTQFLKEAFSFLNPGKSGDEYKHVGSESDDEDTSFHLKNRVLNMTKSLKGKEVSGAQARLLILAANKNVKKLYLYNSGFYIVLRGPSLSEINLVYNRLSDKMGEYGRQFGAVFYMYSDFAIRDIIWTFIESLVIDSNLNKWDKGNRLRNSVSFLDYNPIVLGIGTLMFKNGYQFIHCCTDGECGHTSEETVDLSLLQLTDFSKIPHDLLANMARSKRVNPDEVISYKKKLGLNDSIVVGNYKIHRKVPSMTDYLSHGEAFNEELAMSVQDIANSDYVDQYLKYNYGRLFLPWISYMESLDDEGGVSFKLVDKDSISLALNELQQTESLDQFRIKMNEFIQKSMITQIGYLAKPCEKCNAMPNNSVNGFVPFDAQNSFFTMLVMRLIQAS